MYTEILTGDEAAYWRAVGGTRQGRAVAIIDGVKCGEELEFFDAITGLPAPQRKVKIWRCNSDFCGRCCRAKMRKEPKQHRPAPKEDHIVTEWNPGMGMPMGSVTIRPGVVVRSNGF